MAFSIHKTEDGRTAGVEYLPCGAFVPKAGMLLKTDGGKLAPAGGADKPRYMSLTHREAACQAGELIPVMRVLPDVVLESATPVGFAGTVGDTVQLDADGLNLSGTAGGAAEVVYTDTEKTRVRIG